MSSAYRRARRAEGRGEYREAAALYAEADMPEDAANALLFHAARAGELGDRLAAYHDALRWLPQGHPRRGDVEGQIGLTILDDAQRRGAHTTEDRARLEDAAARLERSGCHAEAATAFELLERNEDVARNLQLAGDVERLEALLDETTEHARRERALRRLVDEYEMSMAVGARVEARRALQEALDVAPEEPAIRDLLRRLESRRLALRRLRMRVDDRELAFVAGEGLEMGRDAEVLVRGASVSRRHARVSLDPEDGLRIEDLGSRNGTLLRGVPIDGALRVEGGTEIGLGDDVQVRVSRRLSAVQTEVLSGLDRGLVALAGTGPLPIPDVPATVSFPHGYPTLTADPGVIAWLGRQKVAAPIALLAGDVVELRGHRIEIAP